MDTGGRKRLRSQVGAAQCIVDTLSSKRFEQSRGISQHQGTLGSSDAVESADAPSERADWTVTTSGRDFLLR